MVTESAVLTVSKLTWYELIRINFLPVHNIEDVLCFLLQQNIRIVVTYAATEPFRKSLSISFADIYRFIYVELPNSLGDFFNTP